MKLYIFYLLRAYPHPHRALYSSACVRAASGQTPTSSWRVLDCGRLKMANEPSFCYCAINFDRVSRAESSTRLVSQQFMYSTEVLFAYHSASWTQHAPTAGLTRWSSASKVQCPRAFRVTMSNATSLAWNQRSTQPKCGTAPLQATPVFINPLSNYHSSTGRRFCLAKLCFLVGVQVHSQKHKKDLRVLVL